MKRLAIALVVLAACGNKESASKRGQDFSKSCTGASLVEPWPQLSLPIADGRICRSQETVTQVQYMTKTGTELRDNYEQALLAKGYEKEKCHEKTKGIVPRCFYFKRTPGKPKHELTVDVHVYADDPNYDKDAKLI